MWRVYPQDKKLTDRHIGSIIRESYGSQGKSNFSKGYRNRHTSELSLDGRWEVGAVNITINRCLGREDSVEVGNILNTNALNERVLLRRHALTTGLDTLGLNGGCIFFCRSFLKSMWFTKNGCFLISSAPFTPSRFEGSLLRRLVRMLRASAPMSEPKVSGSVRIFWYILSVTSEVDDQRR